SPRGVAPPVNDDCAPTASTRSLDATIAATSSVLEGKTTPVAVPLGTCAASLRNDWRRSGSRVMGGNNSALTLLRRALRGSAFRCRRAARPAFRPLCGGAVL